MIKGILTRHRDGVNCVTIVYYDLQLIRDSTNGIQGILLKRAHYLNLRREFKYIIFSFHETNEIIPGEKAGIMLANGSIFDSARVSGTCLPVLA